MNDKGFIKILGTDGTQPESFGNDPAPIGGGKIETLETYEPPTQEVAVPTTSPLMASWESKAEQVASTQFQQNVAQATQTSLRNAQEIQQKGREADTSLALGEYVRQQSIEKAGWTGGYKLDKALQAEYLKATIAADMYGAQELQRLGIESQLESARLAYDLGKEQLAMQYYNEAWSRSVQEAQITERWVSPEIRDMLNQWEAAGIDLSNLSEGTPEHSRALRIKTQIEDWFSSRNITPTDINTYARATFQREMADRALLDAAFASVENSPSQFIAKDANGKYLLDDNGRYVILDYATIGKEDLFNYLDSFEGATFNTGAASLKSYLTFLGRSSINGYLSSLKEDEEATQEGFLEFLDGGTNNQILNYIRSSLGIEAGSEDETKLLGLIGESISTSLTSGNKSLSFNFLLTGGTQQSEQTESPTSTATRYTQQWYTDIGIADFRTHQSVVKSGNFYTISYLDNNDKVQTRTLFKNQLLDAGYLVYGNQFAYDTSWNTKKTNQDFNILFVNKEGNRNQLRFEMGAQHVSEYFGFFGFGNTSNNDLTFRTIGTDGKGAVIDFSDLKSAMKIGELRFIQVEGQGGTERRNYLLTKDNLGNLRVIEAADQTGMTNHKAILKMMGYSDALANTVSGGHGNTSSLPS